MHLIALFRLLAILVIGLIFSSCLPAARTEIAPRPSATSTLANAEAPTTVANNEPTTLELGQPFWIGRGKIVKAVFLPGAKQVAIAWGSGVSLNVTESGEELWNQPTPTNLISFDVQPQGQAFAAALADGSVMIFDASNGTSQRVEGTQPNAYWGDIAWSPNGKLLAFQFIGPNRSDPIYLLEVASGQVREVPNSETGDGVIPQLIWSPDGLSISIALLGDSCPRFVDIQTGEERMRLGEPPECYLLASLLFLSDGKMMAVQTQSGEVDLLQFPDGARLNTLQRTANILLSGLLEFPATDGSLFLDPGGQWIATRAGYEPCYCGSPQDQPDHPLIVWDLTRGTVLAQLDQALDRLSQRHRLAAAFDGSRILMLYASGEITHWDFTDPQAEETVQAQVTARPVAASTLNWSADVSHLAFTGSYGGVDVYQTDTGQLVQRFEFPLEYPSLSPDGQLVALFDPTKKLEVVYRVRDGHALHALPASPVLMGPAFSPDGSYFVYGEGAHASVVDLVSGQVTSLDPAPAVPVTADMSLARVIWSPDGQALVTVFAAGSAGSGGPGVIVLWERLADNSFGAIYHARNVQANYTLPNLVFASFDPSGNRVAIQSLPEPEAAQMDVILYDLEAGKVIQTVREYKLAAWINDEELLVAEAQYDTRLTRIHVISGEKVIGGGRDLGDNAYAPGGLFTAQLTGPPLRGVTIRHWQSEEVVAQGVHEALNLLEFRWSPDGRWLVSIGDDGTLRIWPVISEK